MTDRSSTAAVTICEGSGTESLHEGVLRSNLCVAVLMKVITGLMLASCVRLSHLSSVKACGSVTGTVKQ